MRNKIYKIQGVENLPTLLKDRVFILNMVSLVMDRDRIYSIIRKLSPISWFTRPSTKFLLKYYKNTSITGAEIGVDYGLNAKTILKILNLKKLYLIDPYIQKLDNVSGDERFNSAKKYLSKYNEKIIFIRKTSEDAINDIPSNLDFIYIDGLHDYENIKKDIELYYPKVKSGGILGGHDFWGNEIGVCKAVLEFVENNNLKLYGELTDWWIIKK